MAAKKTEEVKTEVKTATATAETAQTKKPAKKTTAKTEATKPAAKKPATKKQPEKKVVTKIQYGGKELDTEELAEACKADYRAKTNGNVRSLSIYIKPEESAVYYVVNDKFSDKIDV